MWWRDYGQELQGWGDVGLPPSRLVGPLVRPASMLYASRWTGRGRKGSGGGERGDRGLTGPVRGRRDALDEGVEKVPVR